MVHTFLTYSEVFGDEWFVDWDSLTDLGPEGYLRVVGACFLLSENATKQHAIDPSKPLAWYEIRNFFSPGNLSVGEMVLANLKSPLLSTHRVFSNYVILLLLNKNKSGGVKVREIGPDDELRMLKAVLTVNQEVVEKQSLSNLWLKPNMAFNKPIQGLWRSFYATTWPFFEVNNLNVPEQICLETIKCSLLVDWLSEYHKGCLDKIEDKLGFKVNEGYLSASMIAFKIGVAGKRVFEIFNHPQGIAGQVFESISSVEFSSEVNNDFTYLKANPVYKIDSNCYAVRFMPFLVPAFGTGLYFKARDAYSEIDPKFEFRSQFTKSFNEGYLVKSILSWCFDASSYQVIDVDDLLDGSDKKADFIVSNHKLSLVIEVKDNLIADNFSGSITAEEIEKKIDSLFCRDEKEGQGLVQLARTINRLAKGNQDQTGLRFDDHNFFPILLVSSSKLKCSGVNLQVNAAWEDRFLSTVAKDLSKLIQPVTIIQTDSLIYYADYFFSGQVKLEDLLSEYHQSRLRFGLVKDKPQTKESYAQGIYRCADSFYTFINEKMNSRGFKKITQHYYSHGLSLGSGLWEEEK